MGSWSVYCGISRIAITAGQKCVLLPIKANHGESNGYTTHLPATLPIFGEYDDYGGLENIEHNANTKLIEEHFNTTIEKFCAYFTRGCVRTDENDFPKELLENETLKKWSFMFINRKVYDFMSSNIPADSLGHLDFGDKNLLELLGFTYIGENLDNPTYDPKRYKYEWDFNGKRYFSDGTWLHYDKNNAIYNFADLKKITKLPEDKWWIGEKAMWQLWKYLSKSKRQELLGWIMGSRHMAAFDDQLEFLEKIATKLADKLDKNSEEYKKFEKAFSKTNTSKTIVDKYMSDIETFGDGLAELVTVRRNMHSMSGTFEPYILYLTPQCGEPKEHQVLLNAFSKINKEIMKERGY